MTVLQVLHSNLTFSVLSQYISGPWPLHTFPKFSIGKETKFLCFKYRDYNRFVLNRIMVDEIFNLQLLVTTNKRTTENLVTIK